MTQDTTQHANGKTEDEAGNRSAELLKRIEELEEKEGRAYRYKLIDESNIERDSGILKQLEEEGKIWKNEEDGKTFYGGSR